MPRDYTGRRYDVIEYDPAWVGRFEREAATVRSVFGADALDIQHVGSTSVPGMAGKPLIDVSVTVADIADADRHAAGMVAAGYAEYGDLLGLGGRLFSREDGGHKLVNVHVFTREHPHGAEMVAIRDFLRANPDEVCAYADLKRALFEKYPDDYAGYRREKDEYMKGVVARATAGA